MDGFILEEPPTVGKCLSREELWEHAKNPLKAAETPEIIAHLDECPLCQDALAGMQYMHNPNQLSEAVETLNARIDDRLKTLSVNEQDWRQYYMVAAAFLLVLLPALFFIIRQASTPDLTPFMVPYPNTAQMLRGDQSSDAMTSTFIAYEEGRYEEALVSLGSATDISQAASNVQFYKAMCYIALGDMDKARPLLAANTTSAGEEIREVSVYFIALFSVEEGQKTMGIALLDHLVENGNHVRRQAAEVLETLK